MTFKIFQASESDHYESIRNHIKTLDKDDRYLRFGYSPANDRIDHYVSSTVDSDKSIWILVENDGILIGTLHIALGDNAAEFGLTVSKESRGMGVGKLMFSSAYIIIIEKGISQILLYCLSQNKAIQKIARSFGLQIITCGPDAEATVTIQYPVPLHEMKNLKNIITLTDPKIINLQ